MKRIYFIMIATLLFSTMACKKFLDVKPKTQVEMDVAFADEAGYQQALTGIYIKLTSQPLYGKELTYGMVDVMGRQYSRAANPYPHFDLYNYELDSVKKRTVAVWKEMYNGIANANNLIANLERADRPQFSGVNYNIIKGEALGLRAFMHFDVLRLYAPAPASNGGMEALAIPYLTKFSSANATRGTVRSVIENITADLRIAAELLKTSDPILPGNPPATNYLRNRNYKFNYYAVKALQARVYLYAGDKVNALACAEEVINSNAFPFANAVAVTNGQDKVFVSELIFALNINDLHTTAAKYFGTNDRYLEKEEWQFKAEFDEVTSDYRYASLTALRDGFYRYSTKYLAASGALASYLYKMPVIRASEAYYIAAECLIQTDKSKALQYLNAVRRARNLSNDVAETISDVELQNQIFREYRREFLAEGQLFYYYKRVNAPVIENSAVPGSNAVYVLPLPEDELKYGN